MKTILASVAVLAAALSGAAQAQTVTATLQTPTEKPRRLITGGTVWDCRESTCTVIVNDGEGGTWQTCRALVRRTGAVTAFAALPADQLAKCNEAAAK